MSTIRFARCQNSSAFLLSTLGGLWLVGCGSSSEPANPAGGGASAQAGSAGASQAQGGGSASGSAGQPAGGAAAGGSVATTAGTASGGVAGTGGGGAGVSGNGGSAGAGVDPTTLDKFSFFVTSMVAMRKLSKSEHGFGGDLTYGTGDGLMGADKICSEIAESSMPGASAKEWHAFLSTVKGPVHAKSRIGDGPWYDRTGRLVAETQTDLLQNRPNGANPTIKEDLPNETGVPNHRPDPTAPEDDNHHTLTGSDGMGMLYTQNAKSTCLDWTSSSRDNLTTGRPRIGFCWSTGNRSNWISGQDEGGCGAGVTGVGIVNGGSDPTNPIVGSGGGYGAIYCFAMVP